MTCAVCAISESKSEGREKGDDDVDVRGTRIPSREAQQKSNMYVRKK